MVSSALLSQVKSLNAAERLELIEAVWETFSPQDILLTEEEKVLLDARLLEEEIHPAAQSSWPEAQARLRRLLP